MYSFTLQFPPPRNYECCVVSWEMSECSLVYLWGTIIYTTVRSPAVHGGVGFLILTLSTGRLDRQARQNRTLMHERILLRASQVASGCNESFCLVGTIYVIGMIANKTHVRAKSR